MLSGNNAKQSAMANQRDERSNPRETHPRDSDKL